MIFASELDKRRAGENLSPGLSFIEKPPVYVNFSMRRNIRAGICDGLSDELI